MQGHSSLVRTLLDLPIFEAEWVLWLLIGLSLMSVAIIVERVIFYHRRRIDSDTVRSRFNALLEQGDYAGAAEYLNGYDSLETNVVLFALREYKKGPDSVEDLLAGAETRERLRFSRRLGILATVGSNAPFIGLFGTVLGIIKAFRDLAGNMNAVGNSVMFGISEALVATAVGLLVAIPAVIAYNAFMTKVKEMSGNTELLSRTLLAQLKSEESIAAPKGA
jgi:biopolymer transport protein ExbB/TolQ